MLLQSAICSKQKSINVSSDAAGILEKDGKIAASADLSRNLYVGMTLESSLCECEALLRERSAALRCTIESAARAAASAPSGSTDSARKRPRTSHNVGSVSDSARPPCVSAAWIASAANV